MTTTNNRKVGLRLHVADGSYLVLDAFGAYPAIASDAYRQLPEAQRAERVAAFYAHLSTLLGINVQAAVLPGYEDSVLDGTACPVSSYFLVQVSAERGTATIQSSGATSGIFPSGATLTVTSSPATPYNAFVHWENQRGEPVSTDREYTFDLYGDVQLKAVFADVVRYTVVVGNSDGFGAVSGGGTVPANGTVYISAAALNPSVYKFTGWYVKGTNTLVGVPESGFYAPQPEYADGSNTITLEARYILASYAIHVWITTADLNRATATLQGSINGSSIADVPLDVLNSPEVVLYADAGVSVELFFTHVTYYDEQGHAMAAGITPDSIVTAAIASDMAVEAVIAKA